MTDLHRIDEQWQTEDGYAVRCSCGVEFIRSSRADALEGHTGHWNVMRARAALRKEGDGS